MEDANSFSIDSMVHLETRLLGQKWTKKWRSRLFEDEIVEFLNEIQEYAKHIARMMDVIYLLGGYQFNIKQFSFYPGTVLRKRPKFWRTSTRGSKHVKNFEIFWINNNKTIIEFVLAFIWCKELCRSRKMFSIQLGVQRRWIIIILLDLYNSSHPIQPHSIIV